MPYTWSDKFNQILFQIEIVRAVFFMFHGLIFLFYPSVMLSLFFMIFAVLININDNQTKLELIIEKAIKKSYRK